MSRVYQFHHLAGLVLEGLSKPGEVEAPAETTDCSFKSWQKPRSPESVLKCPLVTPCMGREGIEPLVATPKFFDAWFTITHEEHDPVFE